MPAARPDPETPRCPHGCTMAEFGPCTIGSLHAPGCREFPSPFVRGRYVCWDCGKFALSYGTTPSTMSIHAPKGEA